MKYINIKENQVSSICQGTMRISNMSLDEVKDLLLYDLSLGINFIDLADIYGGGKSEELIGLAIKELGIRDKLILQSKCSIRCDLPFPMYISTKEYIIDSVNKILERLQTPYLDYLLLHRPDILLKPQDIQEAFDELYNQGKVKHFGVSNYTSMQIELLSHYLHQPIEVNQVQFSLAHTNIIDTGLFFNTWNDRSIDRNDDIFTYCQLHNITIQAYSPFQFGIFEGTFINNDNFYDLNQALQELSNKYQVNKNAIASSWILTLPASMQVVVGSTNKERIVDICNFSSHELTHEEWYKLYFSAGNRLP